MPRPKKSKDQREVECQRVYDSIIESARLHRSGTTIREISKNTGIRCSDTVTQYIDELEEKHLIKRMHSKARSIVPNPGLPLEGYVGAGGLKEKDDNSEPGEIIDLTAELEDRRNYVLIISGDSMIDAGILDGDYVVVRKQSSKPENGRIVVATRKSPYSATVKRFYQRKDGVELKPANSTMQPRFISSQEWRQQEWEIEGVVMAVVRQYDHYVKKSY
jgi:repressor LexA